LFSGGWAIFAHFLLFLGLQTVSQDPDFEERLFSLFCQRTAMSAFRDSNLVWERFFPLATFIRMFRRLFMCGPFSRAPLEEDGYIDVPRMSTPVPPKKFFAKLPEGIFPSDRLLGSLDPFSGGSPFSEFLHGESLFSIFSRLLKHLSRRFQRYRSVSFPFDLFPS